MSRRTGSLAQEIGRMMTRSTRDGGCLMVPHKTGYGVIKYEGGKQMSAHRASFMVHVGPIPDGLIVRHKCDRIGCIEPAHLELGTYKDNERDKWERGRGPLGLAVHNAAPVTPDQIRAAIREYLAGGKSQAEMARRCGVAQSTFGRWVRAEARRDVGLSGVTVGLGSRIATGIQPCGTRAGWFRHRRDNEPCCDPCREANRVYMRAYKDARKLGGAA